MPEPEKPIAWRCENCRKWQPSSIASTIILVDEIGDKWNYRGSVHVKSRFMRRMVVCPPCRRIIGDQP